MYSDEEREQIVRLLKMCSGIDGAEPHVYRNGNEYGIEFEGYQTLKITVEPIFDMDESEVEALINLMARVLPIANHLIDENDDKEAKIDSLLDCVATISILASEKARKTGRLFVQIKDDEEEGESHLTVGEM